MKGGSWFAYAAIALLVLCVASFAGCLQQERRADSSQRAALGAPLSERQILSRRRGAMNTAAIADTTTQ